MSRVYSALTGAMRPAGAALLDVPDDGVWENSDEPAAGAAGAASSDPAVHRDRRSGWAHFLAESRRAPRVTGEIKPEAKRR